MQLTTNRLVIREFAREDVPEVHAYASDPVVTRHMIWGPNSLEDTIAFVDAAIAMQERHPRQDFEMAVTLRETGELIGGCGLRVVGPAQGEIGYCFNPRFWKQGYASEAAEALLRLGFGELGLHRIYATCRPDNTASAAVMRRIGMRYEGHMREHMRYKGQWHDSLLHAILSTDLEK